MNELEDDDRPYAAESAAAPPKAPELERPTTPLAKSWESFWPLATRRNILVILFIVDLAGMPLHWLFFQSIPATLISFLLMALLQAFLIGTYDRIDLVRSAKGKLTLSRTWRVAFFPRAPTRIRRSEFESLSISLVHETHVEDWVILLLLLPCAVFPAVLWWWFVMRPIQVRVSLCKQHGYPDTILFRTTDQAKAREVAKEIADVTGLPYDQ